MLLYVHTYTRTHTYVLRAVTISALLAPTMSARFSFEFESAAVSAREAELGESGEESARQRECE